MDVLHVPSVVHEVLGHLFDKRLRGNDHQGPVPDGLDVPCNGVNHQGLTRSCGGHDGLPVLLQGVEHGVNLVLPWFDTGDSLHEQFHPVQENSLVLLIRETIIRVVLEVPRVVVSVTPLTQLVSQTGRECLFINVEESYLSIPVSLAISRRKRRTLHIERERRL